jgi:hypothetical protein
VDIGIETLHLTAFVDSQWAQISVTNFQFLTVSNPKIFSNLPVLLQNTYYPNHGFFFLEFLTKVSCVHDRPVQSGDELCAIKFLAKECQ